ncbi:hypothetical protein [Streptomyces sp. NPDC058401]|uniref:hypothetical protein n=1 Tax=Streptomyces sp. NPDC058401 TaxID=3346480 RepID=UPI003653DDF8
MPKDAPGTGGSLIGMARGLGTAIGIVLVTPALHTGGGGRLAVLILPAVAVAGSRSGAGAAPAAAERE